jgi:hypothetical protein
MLIHSTHNLVRMGRLLGNMAWVAPPGDRASGPPYPAA